MKTTNKETTTRELRTSLKHLFLKELEQLPEYLEGLEPKERLDYLLKLMPFVLPKVNNVQHNNGEPDEFEIKEYHL